MGNRLRVAVIGGGASGIAATIKLLRAGDVDVTLFEKADRLGGTWRDNAYPGLTCDVPSHLYRYSFAPKADWPFEYATGPEILAYFSGVAEKHGVPAVLRTSTEITSATWDPDEKVWELESNGALVGRFNAVISAVGVLHKPVVPRFAGLEAFDGLAFHSSKWPKDLDVTGKRVAVIGAGSTSVQIVPAIVDKVKRVSLFMRTPQWIYPTENRPIPEVKQQRFETEPQTMQDLFDFLADAFNHRFAASMVGANPEGLEATRAACLANLTDNVHDPDLRRRLTPDYAVGCKRLVVSSAFYPAMQKPSARLVDIGISGFEAEGIRTVDGELHPLDIVVFATGFDTFNFFRPMTIQGENGAELGALWSTSNRAHRSVSVPGFPNFFFIGGPNSPIGNFSFVMTAELQLGYILGLIEQLKTGACRTIQPRIEAMEHFLTEIERAMQNTVWVTGGCTSWYFDKSGKVASWPWTYERFEETMRAPDLAEYVLE